MFLSFFFPPRVGITIPTIEVRYENLSIDADCYVGNRALPTLLNSTQNFFEVCHSLCVKTPQERKKFCNTHLSSFTVKTLQERNSAQHPSLISLCVKPLQERNSAIPISHLSVRKPLKQETQQHPSLISLKTLNKKFSNTHLCVCVCV